MTNDMRKQYKTVMEDHFPSEMKISFGGQELVYRKRTWKLETREGVVEKGLRYGENPGQEAALFELVQGSLTLGDCEFIRPGNSIVSRIDEQGLVQFGKHPGKTNLTDIDNALSILKFFPETPCCAIMKHNNPCGVARADSLANAYERAYFADRIAAFGGCVVLNRPCDLATAHLIAEQYAEVVAAPEYEEGAVERLAKRKNLRIVKASRIAEVHKYADMRFVEFKSLMDGGMIVPAEPPSAECQRLPEDFLPARCEYKGRNYECEREPGERELDDLLFGWLVEQGVSSNSVLFVRDGVTVSIGTGEPGPGLA
ncbi:MAG: IMP cyclohydrolase [Planctomycetota bacterium]|nr:IMP cyclohydrolase [Planctomycetota bacterium]